MKPLGPIPEHFSAREEQLLLGGETAAHWISEAGDTPLFVYSSTIIGRKVTDFRSAMPGRLKLNYAIKANPFAPVLSLMKGLVDGFDIASGGELELVRAAGIECDRVSFAGPGKRDDELRKALQAGVVLNCESESEARRTIALAEQLGETPRIAIRVNPDFELRGSGMKMGGGAKQFGVDVERVVPMAKLLFEAGCDFRGFHIFTGSQSLDGEAIIETQANVLVLAEGLARDIGRPIASLNIGGGFGIPYFHGDTALDLRPIGEALEACFDELSENLRDTEIHSELGRYLVGEAGVYLTRIIDRKESHGEIFLITDGGLHHQLAASGNFGTVVRRNYPVAIANRFSTEPTEVVSVVGCLCTPLDRLADKALLPRAEVGDIAAVFCAGAYGATASPAQFLGHGPATEMLV
ncbi:pyridoxal-dependent decarboxylase, exosortase A system-associated [Qipengyuania atrilutea]|uniref:Pyridoxal-dependent decarboxylase, exosortase A system-associated n=1 Tax=Qipengyuania atrilutea TaxID=2744473 RepID=A0A850GZU1_9SPHN|nr:pyridoxal-dependent decarboxylase, exosortase A system-associated [Actirhodobacter atriluteus]NVD43917.1 pyridoxal-dependent decarboxylase, exosortase A system-associated [Actirhodobacter atriluteus]